MSRPTVPLSAAAQETLGQLRIGSVRYLNALPLIHPWEQAGGEIRLEHPTALAAALVAGELDVALVPIFEALRHPESFAIIDGIAIAARGAVWSVFVAHRGEAQAISEIALDPASLTSANLCRVLFAETREKPPRFLRMEEATADTARLLIGDQANAFREEQGPAWNYLDLAEAWQHLTGLPFVFAAWVVRREVKEPAAVAAAFRELAAAGRREIDAIVASQPDPAFARRYLTQHIRYHLGNPEKEAIHHFRELLIRHDRLPPTFIPLCWI